MIQERFRGDRHYVWCSEQCDATTVSPYSIASLVPPTSNPRDIYKDLQEAVKRKDTHNDKIVRTRAMYIAMSDEWLTNGEMTASDRDDLIHMVTNADFSLWRPILYIILRTPVEARLQVVPPHKRASHGPEYIIDDLTRSEFELVEL
jgi:hypothetical protein